MKKKYNETVQAIKDRDAAEKEKGKEGEKKEEKKEDEGEEGEKKDSGPVLPATIEEVVDDSNVEYEIVD